MTEDQKDDRDATDHKVSDGDREERERGKSLVDPDKAPNLEVDIKDLERGQLVIDRQPSADQLERVMTDVDEYRVADPESFDLFIIVSRIADKIRLDGSISGDVTFKCGRCLSERHFEVDADIDYVLIPRSEWEREYLQEEEIELGPEDLDVDCYDDEIIDLKPWIREAILLELPPFPRCDESLRDSCDAAYEKVVGKKTLEKNEDASVDLRWAKLKEIELSDD